MSLWIPEQIAYVPQDLVYFTMKLNIQGEKKPLNNVFTVYVVTKDFVKVCAV